MQMALGRDLEAGLKRAWLVVKRCEELVARMIFAYRRTANVGQERPGRAGGLLSAERVPRKLARQ